MRKFLKSSISSLNAWPMGQRLPKVYFLNFLFFSSLSPSPTLDLKLPNFNSLLTLRCGTLYLRMYFFHYIPLQYHSSSVFICFCLLFFVFYWEDCSCLEIEKNSHTRLRRNHTPFEVVLKFKFSWWHVDITWRNSLLVCFWMISYHQKFFYFLYWRYSREE